MHSDKNIEQQSLPLLSKVTGEAILKTTPMFQQFLEVKAENLDCLLFFRMGDFYELFFDDAVIASNELDIALTSRGKYDGKPVPMCGVPYHSYMPYLEKLTKKNYKIAICEQIESPKDAKLRGGYKAIVRREVVRIVTPGTLTEEVLLDADKNNFLLSISAIKGNIGLSWMDISTGELYTELCSKQNFITSISRVRPREILVIGNKLTEENNYAEILKNTFDCVITPLVETISSRIKAEKLICFHFAVKSLESFGSFTENEILSCWALLDYVSITQKGNLPPIRFPQTIKNNSTMQIDNSTRKSLEINQTLSGNKKGSLIDSVDFTLTAVGARQLDKDISAPLTRASDINDRLDLIEFLVSSNAIRRSIRKILKSAADIDRAKARIVLSRGGPRDLQSIQLGIEAAHNLAIILDNIKFKKIPKIFTQIINHLNKCFSLLNLLKQILSDNPPLFTKDGGFIKQGYSLELDKIISFRDESRQHIINMEAEERKKTGLNTLKIKFNNVIGHFFEVTELQKNKFLQMQDSDRFIPRQSLKGVSRFVTSDLSKLSELISNSSEEAVEIELQIFEDIKKMVSDEHNDLGDISYAISRLDVASSLAEIAILNNFVRPSIMDDNSLSIIEGRHPSVELSMQKSGEDRFYSNNCILNNEEKIWLITGPNMAGKSTFLRQNALIVILAQVGSFVPAEKAKIGIVDALFSRVGSSDDLASGRSTFMVEMLETASILNQAGKKSLVIMDEVGRGTSTYDGLSLAWAILEHLHNNCKCRTLFATHYHELTKLADTLSFLSCYTMNVKEWENKVIFLYTVVKGIAKGSYGIHVASLAGIPEPVLLRAKYILEDFENLGKNSNLRMEEVEKKSSKKPNKNDISTEINNVIKDIKSIDLDSLSPKEALDKLYTYDRSLKKLD
jgi:DNA mismatch repair protein MutS